MLELVDILWETELQTHANNTNLEPYSFSLKVKPNQENALFLQKVIKTIEENKPARDQFLGLEIAMPSYAINTSIQAKNYLHLDLMHKQTFSRTLSAPNRISVLAEWKLNL